jgi:hypothetical protein
MDSLQMATLADKKEQKLLLESFKKLPVSIHFEGKDSVTIRGNLGKRLPLPGLAYSTKLWAESKNKPYKISYQKALNFNAMVMEHKRGVDITRNTVLIAYIEGNFLLTNCSDRRRCEKMISILLQSTFICDVQELKTTQAKIDPLIKLLPYKY